MKVRKRNGKLQQFNPEKISLAIKAAMNNAGVYDQDELAETIAYDIEKELINKNTKVIEIETLQDIVEAKLMESRLKDVARRYIRYRYDRERIRQGKSKLMSDISEKLNATNVENQNANLDERSFSGRMNEANRVVTKDYALYNCMSDLARNNHLNNEIYIHDLDSYAVGMHNCLSIPFDELLASGFKTRQTDVRSPRSVNTAMQLVAVIMQLQSLQQFGGVSATHLDWTMVPYVRYSFFKHFQEGLKYIECVDNDLTFTKDESKDVNKEEVNKEQEEKKEKDEKENNQEKKNDKNKNFKSILLIHLFKYSTNISLFRKGEFHSKINITDSIEINFNDIEFNKDQEFFDFIDKVNNNLKELEIILTCDNDLKEEDKKIKNDLIEKIKNYCKEKINPSINVYQYDMNEICNNFIKYIYYLNEN